MEDFDGATGAEGMKFDGMDIKLSYVYPPIPDRRHDWLAYPDGEEEDTMLQGWGKTPHEALADLADVLGGVWDDMYENNALTDPDRLHDSPESFDG